MISPVSQYDASQVAIGSKAKISAARVAEVYCCAQAMAVNASDENAAPPPPKRPIPAAATIWTTATASNPMIGE